MPTLHDGPRLAALIQQVTCLTTDELKPLLTGAPTAHEIGRMRGSLAIFGFRFARVGYLYPAFQFEVDKSRVNPTVARINRALLATRSSDEALEWWQGIAADGSASAIELLESGRPELITLPSRN